MHTLGPMAPGSVGVCTTVVPWSLSTPTEPLHCASPPEPRGSRQSPVPLSAPTLLPTCPPQITRARGSGGGSCRACVRRALYSDPSLPRLSLPTHLPPPPSQAPAPSLGTPPHTAEGEISLLPSSQSGSFRVWLHWRPGVHPYLPGSSGYRSRGQTGVVWWHRLAWPGGGQ